MKECKCVSECQATLRKFKTNPSSENLKYPTLDVPLNKSKDHLGEPSPHK